MGIQTTLGGSTPRKFGRFLPGSNHNDSPEIRIAPKERTFTSGDVSLATPDQLTSQHKFPIWMLTLVQQSDRADKQNKHGIQQASLGNKMEYSSPWDQNKYSRADGYFKTCFKTKWVCLFGRGLPPKKEGSSWFSLKPHQKGVP